VDRERSCLYSNLDGFDAQCAYIITLKSGQRVRCANCVGQGGNMEKQLCALHKAMVEAEAYEPLDEPIVPRGEIRTAREEPFQGDRLILRGSAEPVTQRPRPRIRRPSLPRTMSENPFSRLSDDGSDPDRPPSPTYSEPSPVRPASPTYSEPSYDRPESPMPSYDRPASPMMEPSYDRPASPILPSSDGPILRSNDDPPATGDAGPATSDAGPATSGEPGPAGATGAGDAGQTSGVGGDDASELALNDMEIGFMDDFPDGNDDAGLAPPPVKPGEHYVEQLPSYMGLPDAPRTVTTDYVEPVIRLYTLEYRDKETDLVIRTRSRFTSRMDTLHYGMCRNMGDLATTPGLVRHTDIPWLLDAQHPPPVCDILTYEDMSGLEAMATLSLVSYLSDLRIHPFLYGSRIIDVGDYSDELLKRAPSRRVRLVLVMAPTDPLPDRTPDEVGRVIMQKMATLANRCDALCCITVNHIRLGSDYKPYFTFIQQRAARRYYSIQDMEWVHPWSKRPYAYDATTTNLVNGFEQSYATLRAIHSVHGHKTDPASVRFALSLLILRCSCRASGHYFLDHWPVYHEVVTTDGGLTLHSIAGVSMDFLREVIGANFWGSLEHLHGVLRDELFHLPALYPPSDATILFKTGTGVYLETFKTDTILPVILQWASDENLPFRSALDANWITPLTPLDSVEAFNRMMEGVGNGEGMFKVFVSDTIIVAMSFMMYAYRLETLVTNTWWDRREVQRCISPVAFAGYVTPDIENHVAMTVEAIETSLLAQKNPYALQCVNRGKGDNFDPIFGFPYALLNVGLYHNFFMPLYDALFQRIEAKPTTLKPFEFSIIYTPGNPDPKDGSAHWVTMNGIIEFRKPLDDAFWRAVNSVKDLRAFLPIKANSKVGNGMYPGLYHGMYMTRGSAPLKLKPKDSAEGKARLSLLSLGIDAFNTYVSDDNRIKMKFADHLGDDKEDYFPRSDEHYTSQFADALYDTAFFVLQAPQYLRQYWRIIQDYLKMSYRIDDYYDMYTQHHERTHKYMERVFSHVSYNASYKMTPWPKQHGFSCGMVATLMVHVLRRFRRPEQFKPMDLYMPYRPDDQRKKGDNPYPIMKLRDDWFTLTMRDIDIRDPSILYFGTLWYMKWQRWGRGQSVSP
jgi:hypothetical protein